MTRHTDIQESEAGWAAPPPTHRTPLRFAAPALLALLAALAAAPAAAQTTITLVSNTGQADESVGNLSAYDHAQAFTTGAHAAGYKLTGVDLDFAAVESGSSYAVSIWTNGRFGWPGASIGTLTSPIALAANALNSYTTSGIDLAANTTYHVVVDSSSANTSNLQNTDSSSEDSGGQSGWSIANGSLFRDRLATIGLWERFGDSRKLAIKGYATPPSKPVLTLRKWPHPYTPEVVVAGNPPRVVALGHYELSWPKLDAGGLLLHYQFAAGEPEDIEIPPDRFSNINDAGEIYGYVRVIGPRDGVRTIRMRGRNYLANDCEGTGPCEGAGEWSDPPLVVMPDPPGLPVGQVEAPTITGSPALSDSGSDGTWTAGATVEVTLTFSEAVTVDTTGGTPSIGLNLGGTESRSATYLRGSGTTALVFAYTLTATDGSHTSLLVPIDSLALNGGAILSQATATDAALAHSGAAKIALPPQDTQEQIAPRDEDEEDPFTASFSATPQTHNGADAFTVELHFSEAPQGLSYTTVAGGLLDVTGATVQKARRLTQGSNLAWEVTVAPSQSGDITIRLPTRACGEANAVCVGTRALERAATATVRGVPFTASFSGVPAEHDGATAFDIRFHLSTEPAGLSYRTVQSGLFAVTGGRIEKANRLVAGKNNGWNVRIDPTGLGDVTVRVKATTACDTAPGVCTTDGRKLAGGLSVSTAGPPTLSVADATVEESADATLAFTVTLSKARFVPTTVQYATSDGSAAAGSDYTAQSGTLTFGPLETSKTVSVPVLDDVIDEGSETLTLTLSNASDNVRLGDATATGTITNSDPFQHAWLARFGRTVGTHVTDAVGERLRAAPGQSSHVTVGGYRLPLGKSKPGAAESEADPLTALVTGLAGLALGPDPTRPGFGNTDPRLGQTRPAGLPSVRLRDVLLGSSFRLNVGADPAGGLPSLTAWGRVAGTQFDGRDGLLTIDGDVLTGTAGVDGTWDRWLAGVAMSHSRGDGSYAGATGRGEVAQTLTSIHPYLRYAVTDRLDVWGLLGYGWGELELKPTDGRSLETDTEFLMGSIGSRGILLPATETGGFELATRTDAMFTRTTSDAVSSPADRGGNMAGADGAAHRVRLILEGSREVTWAEGRSLKPTMEVGLRHDWGDAETGFGVELGGRIRYADPRLGLTIEGAVRGLLAHEDNDYDEWGASGSLRIAPGSAGQGLALTLAPTWGAASSGVDGLWTRQTTAGLAQTGAGAPAGRLNAEVGYGFAAFDTGLLTPYAGAVLSDGAARTYRLGTRLLLPGRGATGLALTLEGQRQEPAGQQPLNQGLQLQATWGF